MCGMCVCMLHKLLMLQAHTPCNLFNVQSLLQDPLNSSTKALQRAKVCQVRLLTTFSKPLIMTHPAVPFCCRPAAETRR